MRPFVYTLWVLNDKWEPVIRSFCEFRHFKFWWPKPDKPKTVEPLAKIGAYPSGFK